MMVVEVCKASIDYITVKIAMLPDKTEPVNIICVLRGDIQWMHGVCREPKCEFEQLVISDDRVW